MLRIRDALPDGEERSARILAHLLSWDAVARAHTVFLYDAMRSEVRTAQLAEDLSREGKRLCYPRLRRGEKGIMDACLAKGRAALVKGPFGTLEPPPDAPVVPPEEIDLALVPGLAFTAVGGRLGYGGGYYDRYLARCGAVRAGLCFFAQMLDELPLDVYDRKMNYIVTECGIRFCGEEL